ncbi:hypothetical protein TNCV_1371101 [Trichonephila clavipes]|nr:hypothetical protein TNCV_1371101 [Trichonephila clavipes]
MADRRVFLLGSRSLLLEKRRQASKRSFEAGILTISKSLQARVFNVINHFVRQDGVDVGSRVSGDESIYSTVNMVARVGFSVMISVFPVKLSLRVSASRFAFCVSVMAVPLSH